MTGDPNTIDYEALAQDAMRGVVRTILTRVSKTGLPGDHHFYISFDTLASGASLSKRLREKYPEEMTIVLQHRFWDLIVTDDRFEVKLTFDGIPERLVVPFTSIKVFFDPSVRYGLQFEAPDFGPDATAHPMTGQDDEARQAEASSEQLNAPTPIRPTTTRSVSERKPRPARKPKEKTTAETGSPALELAKSPAAPKVVETKPSERPSGAKTELPAAVPHATPAPSTGGAQVVSLDAFRKK